MEIQNREKTSTPLGKQNEWNVWEPLLQTRKRTLTVDGNYQARPPKNIVQRDKDIKEKCGVKLKARTRRNRPQIFQEGVYPTKANLSKGPSPMYKREFGEAAVILLRP